MVHFALGAMTPSIITIEESQNLGQGGTPAVVSYKHQANDRAALVYPNGRATGFTAHYPGGPLHAIADLDTNGDPVAGRAIAAYDYLGGRTLVRSMQNAVSLDLREDAGGASFDASGRPTKWLHRDTQQQGSPTKIGFEYAYDGNGNKLYQKSVHDPLDGQRYAYDSADRLIGMKRGAFSTNPYSYSAAPTAATWSDLDAYQGWTLDGLGNWSQYVTQRGNQAAATETRTDDTFNAYAVAGADENGQGGVAQTHDHNGNLTNDGKKVLKWDAMNRLREVYTTTGTLIATYTYDAGNRRMRKALGPGARAGQSTDYKWCGWRSVEESTPAAATPRIQRVYGDYLDEILCEDANENANVSCVDAVDHRVFPLQTDLYGLAAIWDPEVVVGGGIAEAFEFSPYGPGARLTDGDADGEVNFDSTDARSAFAPGVPDGTFATRYCGHPVDEETGLVYARNRFYGAMCGGWLSPDPLGVRSGTNVYQFVSGRPESQVDPLGLEPVTINDMPPPERKPRSCTVDCPVPPPVDPNVPPTDPGNTRPCQYGDLKPEDNAPANGRTNCAALIALAYTEPDVKAVLAKFPAKCPVPRIACKKCCGPCAGAGGWHMEEGIFICAPGPSKIRGMATYLKHELTHAIQRCNSVPDGNCEERMMMEIEAYKTEAGSDFRGNFSGAVWSSCTALKCKPGEITQSLADSMYAYWRKLP